MLKTEFNNEDGYALIVKAHPLSKMHLDEKYTAKGDFTTFELMKIADVIITDYSACAYEASLLMKPLYFFVPDFDEYVKDRGLNVDVRKELPGAVFTTQKAFPTLSEASIMILMSFTHLRINILNLPMKRQRLCLPRSL